MPASALVLTLALPTAAPTTSAPTTTLQVTAQLPVEQDACLDHAVKELGMSAKRQGNERVWVIAPRFLHPSVVEGGGFTVTLLRGDPVSTVTVRVTWPGDRKAPEVQAELEQRVTSVGHKMVQLCGVAQPAVRCTVAPPGGAPQPCGPSP